MDAKSIGAWQRAGPFWPSEFHLNSGEIIEVAHPENLGFSPDTPVLIIWGGPEGVTMVDVAAIAHRKSPSRKDKGD